MAKEDSRVVKARLKHLGKEAINTEGYNMKIIKYNNQKDISVIFDNGEIVDNVSYSNFSRGLVKSYTKPSVFGVGILGKENLYGAGGKFLKSYTVWHSIIRRCYYQPFHKVEPSYIGCEVCEEWKYYPHFKKWYDENYYEIEGEKMQLDKDILFKGNKIYSPNTCVFVPQRINSLFTRRQNDRGLYPIGVTFLKDRNKYMPQININGKRKHLGFFNTPNEAFYIYKGAKEKYIKEVADEYKDKIPQKLYEAMYSYEVEITD